MADLINSVPSWLLCIIVFSAKVLEISIQSVKTVMMVKKQRLIASMLGFSECMCWGLIISGIIVSLSRNFFLLIAYCCGYAVGMYLGSCIESKLALGTRALQIITGNKNLKIVKDYLHENNRGYTVLNGHGGTGAPNYCFVVVLPRKDVNKVTEDIKSITDNKCFVIASDVSKFTGGYGVKK